MKPLVPTPTLGSRGGVLGRSRKQPPMDAAEKIKMLAAEGRPKRGIAILLGTAADTFDRWLHEDEALMAAFEWGREQKRHEVMGWLERDARDGGKPNVNAIFLAKVMFGYREGSDDGAGARVNVVIQLPASRPLSDYIEVDSGNGLPTKRLPETRR